MMANERLNTVRGEGVWPCNQNLLDNWDFTNPVNQRNISTFSPGTAQQYFIDRWYTARTDISVTDSGLSVNWDGKNASYGWIQQKMEIDLAGKTCTASALIDGELYTATFAYPTEINTNNTNKLTSWLQFSFTLFSGGRSSLVVATYDTAKRTIKAVKLERGPVQTLAHKEGSAWVLNEIPDYGMEMLKCQRYYQIFATEDKRPVEAEDFRPAMRIKPTLSTIVINSKTYYTANAYL